jgi:hypothetical protein
MIDNIKKEDKFKYVENGRNGIDHFGELTIVFAGSKTKPYF